VCPKQMAPKTQRQTVLRVVAQGKIPPVAVLFTDDVGCLKRMVFAAPSAPFRKEDESLPDFVGYEAPFRRGQLYSTRHEGSETLCKFYEIPFLMFHPWSVFL
jgi:hypothetical protein